MEFKLNEDQQMIHDLAKDFAETVLQPRIDEIEQGEMVEVSNGQKHPQLPHDIHQQLAECGFIGISFPAEYNRLGACGWHGPRRAGYRHQGTQPRVSLRR